MINFVDGINVDFSLMMESTAVQLDKEMRMVWFDDEAGNGSV
jgi:hypothetical protein